MAIRDDFTLYELNQLDYNRMAEAIGYIFHFDMLPIELAGESPKYKSVAHVRAVLLHYIRIDPSTEKSIEAQEFMRKLAHNFYLRLVHETDEMERGPRG